MASDSSTTILLNENSDSSLWSSDYENKSTILPTKQQPVKQQKVFRIPEKQKEEVAATKHTKKKNVISICLTHCRYDIIKKVAEKFNFKEVSENENWNVYWTDLSITVERCKEMKRFQKINHFPGMLEICRKDLLARNLNRMQRLFPREYNFFPKTWGFPADLGEAMSYSKLRKNKTFILKPDAGSQGRGIIITRSLKEVRPCDRGICQVYISRPFLIDGYKFDLRVYTLITSCDPLRIYVYNEGLVRFATSKYKEPNGVNISNVFMHLTNYAVNKHSRTYNQDTEGGSKRKLSWLKNYLRSLKQDVDAIWYRIDDVIIKTIISAYPVLKHSYVACFPNHDVFPACCELLGIDIIFDKRMNPQILEVNHSPSFHTDTDLDMEVKDGLISDMFAMMSLDKTDKRRIMREDRKRIRERLLHGHKDHKEYQPNTEVKCFSEYFKNEMSKRGNYRLVYPCANSDSIYGKFFDQGQNTFYCDTASSRAREAAQNALRDEMQLKAKLEAAKRVAPLPRRQSTDSDLGSVRSQPKPPRPPPLPLSIRYGDYKNSFLPHPIIESEEKERLKALAQRDYLLRTNGILEHVYFSLKKNKVIRPHDDRKYAIFEKIRNAGQVINKGSTSGPVISDMIEEINATNRGDGEMIQMKKEIVDEWVKLSKTHTLHAYTEIDKNGKSNLKLSTTFGSIVL